MFDCDSYFLLSFFPYMRIIFWGQISKAEFLQELSILMSSGSENHIFHKSNRLCMYASVKNVTQKQIRTEGPNFLC